MSTAIIVSGVFRHFDIAVNSWKFAAADYYLTTQTRTQKARSAAPDNNILTNIDQHRHKFKSILIKEPTSNINTVNMAAKWLASYNLLKDQQYSKYIILRPDLYIFHYDWSMINNIEPQYNTMYNISNIVDDSLGQPFINDMCFILDPEAWTKIGNFYNYYYPIRNTKNVHIHLYDYIKQHKINVNAEVLALGQFTPVRDNMIDMFDDNYNLLVDKYSVNDVMKKANEWQNQQIES